MRRSVRTRPANSDRHLCLTAVEVSRGRAQDGGMDSTQLEKIRSGRGFFAALDQSGGSTPKALREYGVEEDRYSNDEQMFDLVHAMRTRVVTDSAFDGSRVLAAILFE